MIRIEPRTYTLTLPSGHSEEVTVEALQDLCASAMAILPGPHDDHDCGCSEEIPQVRPADFVREVDPALANVPVRQPLPDTSPPTLRQPMLRGFHGEAVPLTPDPPE